MGVIWGLFALVAAELGYGCAKKGSPRLLAKVQALLETIPVLALDLPADGDYGRIRAELEAAGQPIGGNDLLNLLGLRRQRGHTLYETPLGAVIARLVTTFKPHGFRV